MKDALEDPRLINIGFGNIVAARTLITDVASVKRPVLDWAQRLPNPLRFLGGHPVAGKTKSGLGEPSGISLPVVRRAKRSISNVDLPSPLEPSMKTVSSCGNH